MIRDSNDVPRGETIRGDLCILGAGPAGITIARRFIDAPIRVVLLESGGTDFTKSIRELPRVAARHLFQEQSLTAGKNVGLPYYPLRFTRARAFGGTSRALASHGLEARPLDAIDFEQRDDLELSGWPFGRTTLEAHYRRAQEVCGLGPFQYDGEPAVRGAEGGPEGSFEQVVFHYGPKDKFSQYLGALEDATSIDLVLHANAVNVATSEGSVTGIDVATLAGNRFRVEGRAYVLATGGLENARILLASRQDNPRGVGNDHDLVGRHFMEHPDLNAGVLFPAGQREHDLLPLHEIRSHGSYPTALMLAPSEELMRREGLLNSVIRLMSQPASGAAEAVRSARVLRRSLHYGVPTRRALDQILTVARHPLALARHARATRGSRALPVVEVHIRAEQSPNPDSRVALGTKRDRLGMPLTVLDWRLNDADLESIKRTVELLAASIRRSGLGEMRSMISDDMPPAIFGDWHHLGTTRMSNDPRRGVVDADCKVHGIDNLFVAGGSVFPTGGYANPTLTIVALASRLADHLDQRLR